MKQFFEQYGGVALGILAVLVLIAMITPVGNIVETSLQGTVDKFSSSINGQVDQGLTDTAKAQNSALNVISEGGGESGTLDMSNISTTLATGDFSTKGSLVTVNGASYRVLESNGTQAKLLAMDSYNSKSFGSNNTYSGSTLDTEMTNFYNALPYNVKNAIVPQNIAQSKYSTAVVPVTSSNRTGENSVGERYVYALDVDDVISYLGDNYTAIALNQMFFGDDAGERVSHIVWLRSAVANGTDDAFRISGYIGDMNITEVSLNFEVRPAFIIDLSLLSE